MTLVIWQPFDVLKKDLGDLYEKGRIVGTGRQL